MYGLINIQSNDVKIVLRFFNRTNEMLLINFFVKLLDSFVTHHGQFRTRSMHKQLLFFTSTFYNKKSSEYHNSISFLLKLKINIK